MKSRKHENWHLVELEDGDLPDSAYTDRVPVGEARATGRDGRVLLRVREEAVGILGPHGRLLSASKAAYSERHPDHDVLFNACIFDAAGVEIWFGDVDITRMAPELRRLADRVGPIFLTPERPYRREGLPEKPNTDPAIHAYRPRRA